MNEGSRSNAGADKLALPTIKATINLDELQNDSPLVKIEKKRKRNISTQRRKQVEMRKTMRDTIPPHAT